MNGAVERERHDFGPAFLVASSVPILPRIGQIWRFSGLDICSFVQIATFPGLIRNVIIDTKVSMSVLSDV